MLLANHGPVVSGSSLEAAVYAAEELEETAKLFLMLRDVPVRPLDAQQIAELKSLFHSTFKESTPETSMPRFAANLSMMYNEVPFPHRFAAAANDGFKAVEFLFPYDHRRRNGRLAAGKPSGECAVQHAARRLGGGRARHGGAAGTGGRVPRRLDRAIEYTRALGTKLHMMAGLIPQGSDMDSHRKVYLKNLGSGGECGAGGT